jgi:hypothetical protein
VVPIGGRIHELDVQAGLLFRQYSLVKWLEANYKPCLESREAQELTRRVDDLNERDGRQAAAMRRNENIKRLVPPLMLPALHRSRVLSRFR